MIKIYPADSRYSADHGWLRSNFSFSFAEYYDPANTGFGVMRVLNDDTIQGGRGFGAHPHREMEIVTVVLKGQLKHEDSTGRSAITTFGQVQRMSAGTGIVHSEINPGEEEVQLLQMWFMPGQSGLEPSYETSEYDPDQMINTWLPIVSSRSGKNIAHIHQDMTIYLSRLEAGKHLEYEQEPGRKIFLFVIEGALSLNGSEHLKQRDSARISGESSINVGTDDGAFLMLIDLP